MINNIDIQENGKLICEFMELRTIDKRAKKNPQFHIPFSTIVYADYYLGCCSLEPELNVHASDTLFHESWDWLMEVVRFIEDIPNTQVSMHKTHAYVNHRGDSTEVVTGKDRKESLYKAVVEFIHWYNKKK